MEGLGLTVLEGGRHPGRGTANLIVPFGRQYLELLCIVDEDEANTVFEYLREMDELADLKEGTP